MSAQQFVANFALEFVDVRIERVFADFEEQLAGQRVAVGVQSVRSQAENHVADFHRLAGDDALALDRSDDESRQIVFAIR